MKLLVQLSVVALLLAATPVAAQVTTPARNTLATISFNDVSFNNAAVRLDATQTIGAGSSGQKQVTFDAFPTLQSYNLSSTGQVNVSLNAFTPPSSFDLTVAARDAGTWTIAETFVASDDPINGPPPLYRFSNGNDLLIPFTNSSLPALELYLPIAGLVDDGGSFGIGFVIPGDFSTTAALDSRSGQHFLAYLDPDWSIDTNFVYDAGVNVTRFHATNPNYTGLGTPGQSPQLDVYFFGNAVPEPATWASMILGFGVVGAAMRRQSKKISLHLI